MKSSSIYWLSKTIALPLLIIFNIATPSGAEQIGRSRSKVVDPLPAATDLNLSIPTSEIESSIERPELSSLPPDRRANSRRNSVVTSATREASASKAKDPAKRRNAVASNMNSVRSLTIEQQPLRTRSTVKARTLVATNINISTEEIARSSQKIQSNPRPKIATGSPLPLSGNYLRLVRDPAKGTNDVRNPIYTLEAYVDGQIYQTFNAVSGTATTQAADRHRGNNFAPLPDGLYKVNNYISPGILPEVGRTFIAIYPKFETSRNELGIHLDRSFNKRNGYDGTAGCIGITTTGDRDAINEFVTRYRPRNLFVNIMSSDN